MARQEWTHNPIAMWEPEHNKFLRQADKIKEDNEMFNSLPWATEAPKGDVDLLYNARIFHDLDNSGEMVRGLMTADEAMAQGMQESYTRGILAKNQAHNVYAASMIVGGYNDELYDDDSILKFTDANEAFMQKAAGRSRWNLAKAIPGGGDPLPLFEFFGDTPEDAFQKPPPKGWNTSTALEVLKESDPKQYWIYERELGEYGRLEEIVAGARNPYEFFYKLSLSLIHISEPTRPY